ncbi:MAG: hypothetical protein IJL32_12180 [Oscillospiraceae bacterium]|nr:hypothetical protein [Oscillospiraceae bacterium]
MDEYLKPVVPAEPDITETDEVDTSVNFPDESEKPKRYSLKSAQTALKRMQADMDKKTEQLAVLKKEIAALKPEIRSMTALVKQLQQEETERKMRDAFRMKSKHMTEDQVMKALDIVQELDGDLDDIDIDELTKIIRAEAGRKRERAAQPANANIGSTTSIQTGDQTGTQNTEE